MTDQPRRMIVVTIFNGPSRSVVIDHCPIFARSTSMRRKSARL
jgi:hypothetical protein